jgi:hypothetical protein
MFIAFFLSPFVIHHLGNSAYGVWVLMLSMTGYLGLLDLGIRGTVTCYVAKFHAEGKHQEASRLVSFALMIFTFLGAIALLTFFLVRQVEHADRTLEVKTHDATAVNIKRPGNGRGAGIVHVRLDDGRDVDAFSMLRLDPATGSHVIINEARHASGRLTYDVARLAE